MATGVWITKSNGSVTIAIPLPQEASLAPYVEAGCGAVSRAGLASLRQEVQRQGRRLVEVPPAQASKALALALSPCWVPQ